MALNLRKHQDSLIKAYRDVSNNNSKTDWVIFGYEGLSNILKVVATGDGGLPEVVDEVSSGHIQYIYCMLKDPTTNLNKFVLINWQGQGARENFRIKCASHIEEIKSFLKTIHVTINARCEEDVDIEAIFTKFSKSTSANYNVKSPPSVATREKQSLPKKPITAKPPAREEDPPPVSSVYKKVNINREISIESREEFWTKQEEEEAQRIKHDRRKSQTERINFEKERKAQDKREAEERDRRIQEKARQIREMKNSEKTNERHRKLSEKEKWDQEQAEIERDDEERRKRSESLRKERVAEATALLSNKAGQRKAFFEQKAAENAAEARNIPRQPPPTRKVKKFQPAPTPQSENFEGTQSEPVINTRSEPVVNTRSEPVVNTRSEAVIDANQDPVHIQYERGYSDYRDKPDIRSGDWTPNQYRYSSNQTKTGDSPNRSNDYEAAYGIENEHYMNNKLPSERSRDRSSESEALSSGFSTTSISNEYDNRDHLSDIVPQYQDNTYDEPELNKYNDNLDNDKQSSYPGEVRDTSVYQSENTHEFDNQADYVVGDSASLNSHSYTSTDHRADMVQAHPLPENIKNGLLPTADNGFDDDREEPPPDDDDWNEDQGEDISPAPVSPEQVRSETGDFDNKTQSEIFYDAQSTDSMTTVRGPSVQALFDYQAEEEGEITFDPGDIITDVDEIDPGWWIGTAPDGSRGMFPANYVQKI